MAIVVKKVTKQIPQSAPLETFLTSLGITTKATIYLCNSNAYINSDIILPVLSVPIQWFLKNSETPLHYIKIKPKDSNGSLIYINKYGLTKLLAQSKEAVAFKLQDYLYELLYKVETEPSVSKLDVASRQQLIKMTTELEMYRSSTSTAVLETIELKESIDTIRADYAMMSQDYQKLKLENENHEAMIKELESEVNNYKVIANKLARYVRANSKKPPTESFDDSLEIDESEEPDEVTLLEITADAIKAKKALKTKKAPMPKKVVSTVKTITLLRSADGVGNEYKWELSDKLCDDAFKQLSRDYCLGDIDAPPDAMLWYSDIDVTDEKRRIICLFLSLLNFYPESTIIQLIQ